MITHLQSPGLECPAGRLALVQCPSPRSSSERRSAEAPLRVAALVLFLSQLPLPVVQAAPAGAAVVPAAPAGPTVTHGSATFVSQGSQLTITTSDRAAINWQSFNIGLGQTTTFVEPSASSVVWNLINDPNPSQILGNP